MKKGPKAPLFIDVGICPCYLGQKVGVSRIDHLMPRTTTSGKGPAAKWLLIGCRCCWGFLCAGATSNKSQGYGFRQSAPFRPVVHGSRAFRDE